MKKTSLIACYLLSVCTFCTSALIGQVYTADKGTFILFDTHIQREVSYTITTGPLRNETYAYPVHHSEFIRRYRDAQAIFGEPVPLTDEQLVNVYSGIQNNDGGAKAFQTHPTLLLAMGSAAFTSDQGTFSEVSVDKKTADKTTTSLQLKLVDHQLHKAESIRIVQEDTEETDIKLVLRFSSHHWIDSARVTKQLVGSDKTEKIEPIVFLTSIGDSTEMLIWDTAKVIGEFIYFIQPHDKLGKWHTVLPGFYTHNYTQHTAPRFTDFQVEMIEASKSVKLTWTTNYPARVRGYSIYRAAGQSGTFHHLADVPAEENTYFDQVRGSMFEYFYYIVVKDQFGPGDKSIIRFAIPHTKEKPEPPPTVMARPVPGGVELAWPTHDAFNNTQGYYVFRQTKDRSAWEQISPFLIRKEAGMTYVDTSAFLDPVIEYAYAVRSESSSYILSENSAVAYARPDIPRQLVPPGVPAYRFMEGNTLVLYWNDMRKLDPYITAYHVFETDAAGKIGKEVAGSPVDAVHFAWEAPAGHTLADGYVVLAEDAWGNRSAYSAIIKPTHEAKSISPQNLIIKPTTTGFRLQWGLPDPTAVKNIQLYEIADEGKPTLVKSLANTVRYFDVLKLKSNEMKSYYITYKLMNGNESERSEVVIVSK
jgi:hypothetical protein